MSEETSKVSRGGQGATVDLDKLERLAWSVKDWGLTEPQDSAKVAEFIAAANPAVVLELIRRVRAEANEIEALRAALSEIRDRIVDHPLYSPLTEDEEEEVGGDAAELSYLVRVADAALEPQKVGDAEMQAGG